MILDRTTTKQQLLVLILFVLIPFFSYTQEWQDCNCDNPIQYRICESGKDYQVKSKFDIPTSMEKCIKIFCDADNHTKWIYECSESQSITNNGTSGIFRNIIDAPLFMKDREVFVEYKIQRNIDGSTTVTNVCLPDYRPRNNKYERITRFKATYKFTAKTNDVTTVEYFTETGGPKDLPKLLLYIFLCKSTQETIEKLKNIAY